MGKVVVFLIYLLGTGSRVDALAQQRRHLQINSSPTISIRASPLKTLSLRTKYTYTAKKKPVQFSMAAFQYAKSIAEVEFKEDLLLQLSMENIFPNIRICALFSDLDLGVTNNYLVKLQIALNIFR